MYSEKVDMSMAQSRMYEPSADHLVLVYAVYLNMSPFIHWSYTLIIILSI